MKIVWLFGSIIFFLSCISCTNMDKTTVDKLKPELIQSNKNTTSMSVLTALRDRDNVSFENKTRNFSTTIDDKLLFETNYPGTDITCGYVLRFYFYTNILLNQGQSELFSMDGTQFILGKSDQFDESSSDQVIDQTKSIINLIGGMNFGSSELSDFLDLYPNAIR